MKTLVAHNLSCGYGRHQVLQSVSLAARAGEVLVLVGANGAGKTTLLRALARILKPSAGSVLLDDQDIWQFSARGQAQQVALMPQSERRDWPLTVEDSVRLGRAPHRGWLLPFNLQDQQVVQQALATTGLWELRERPITELSGGEWRRMVLARALAQQPGALLLDEPTAGLDLKYQGEVLRLVQQLAVKQQLIVILTLHDLNHASLYGHRLAVLAHHRLLAVGAPEEVLSADIIQEAFGVPVLVTRHPVHETPLVVPLNQA